MTSLHLQMAYCYLLSIFVFGIVVDAQLVTHTGIPIVASFREVAIVARAPVSLLLGPLKFFFFGICFMLKQINEK